MMLVKSTKYIGKVEITEAADLTLKGHPREPESRVYRGLAPGLPGVVPGQIFNGFALVQVDLHPA